MVCAINKRMTFNFEGQKEGIKETKLTNTYFKPLTATVLTGLAIVTFTCTTNHLQVENNVVAEPREIQSTGDYKTNSITKTSKNMNVIQKTFNVSNSFSLKLIDELNTKEMKALFLSNNAVFSQSLLEPFPSAFDIIDNKDVMGGVNMYEKLIHKRDKFEKNGIALSFGLAIISLLTSVFSQIHFSTILPATFMLLSFSAFLFLKRKARKEQ